MVPLCGRMPQSYARVVSNSGQSSNPASEPLCPDAAANGICKLLDCHFLHGDICDMCGRAALHPYNKQQSQQHTSVIKLIIIIEYTKIMYSLFP